MVQLGWNHCSQLSSGSQQIPNHGADVIKPPRIRGPTILVEEDGTTSEADPYCDDLRNFTTPEGYVEDWDGEIVIDYDDESDDGTINCSEPDSDDLTSLSIPDEGYSEVCKWDADVAVDVAKDEW